MLLLYYIIIQIWNTYNIYIYCLCVLQDCRKFAQNDLRRSLKQGYAKYIYTDEYIGVLSQTCEQQCVCILYNFTFELLVFIAETLEQHDLMLG